MYSLGDPEIPAAQDARFTDHFAVTVNQLCHTALIAGLIDKKSALDQNTIRKAAGLCSGASVADIYRD